MNQSQRTLLAHAAIAVALLVGAYMGVVDRIQQRLVSTRAEAASLTSQVRDAEHFRDLIPQLAEAMKRAEGESARINRLGAVAADERGLYKRLIELASRHDVTLDEVNPASPSTPPVTAKPIPDPAGVIAAPAKPVEHAIAFSMTATANYAGLAAFVRGLQTELGYSVVKSINLSPVPDERGLVRAVLATEHYAFDVTPKVATGDDGGKER